MKLAASMSAPLGTGKTSIPKCRRGVGALVSMSVGVSVSAMVSASALVSMLVSMFAGASVSAMVSALVSASAGMSGMGLSSSIKTSALLMGGVDV